MNGSTQLSAFEEVGKKLGRTSGACGFRWNAVLRQRDPDSYSEAKKKRVSRQLRNKQGQQMKGFSRIASFIREVEKDWLNLKEDVVKLSRELEKKEEKVRELREENRRLTEEKRSYEWYQQEVKEKYQSLLQMLRELRAKRGDMREFLAENEPESGRDTVDAETV
jgi:prespore-specific regulator